MKMYLKKKLSIFRDLFDLFYTPLCFACKSVLLPQESDLCMTCTLEIPSFMDNEEISDRLRSKFFISATFSRIYGHLQFQKTGNSRNLLHGLKYGNLPRIGEVMGKQMAKALQRKELAYDLVIPVPLHSKKLRSRGYNQSDKIAKAMAETLGVSYETKLLNRVLDLKSQTKNKRKERLLALSGAFTIDDSTKLEGKTVLLVDDMLTTGATIESCVKVLLQAKVSQVEVAVMCFGL